MASEIIVQSVAGSCEEDEQPPKLFQKSDLTDITLIIEGKELHFVKYLLIEGSTVLAEMLKSSADPSRLKIDDLTYEDMIMFLTCLHPKCFLELNDKNLEPVATIGRKFEYERIIRICEQYIMAKFNEVRTSRDGMYPEFFFHLRVADKCGLHQAIEFGVSSKQAEMAYFSTKLKDPNLKELKQPKPSFVGITRRSVGIPTTNIIACGYENDIDFSRISWKTKFKIISRRLKAAEKMIPVDNPY